MSALADRPAEAKMASSSCDLAVGPAPKHRPAPPPMNAKTVWRHPPALPPMRSTLSGSAIRLRASDVLSLERSTDLGRSDGAEYDREARSSPREQAAPRAAVVRLDAEAEPARVASRVASTTQDLLDEQLVGHREKYGRIAEERRKRALQINRTGARDFDAAAEDSGSRVGGFVRRFSRHRRRVGVMGAVASPRHSGSLSRRPANKNVHFRTAAQCALTPLLRLPT